MHYSDKIKALQRKCGIEEDGIPSSKTWLHIYHLLFDAVPYNINIDSMIKAIQQKIEVRADGYPWTRTWEVLYDLLIANNDDNDINTLNNHVMNVQNGINKEVIPFVNELIHLAADNGINVEVLPNTTKEPSANAYTELDFGLKFKVKVCEQDYTAIDHADKKTSLSSLLANLGQSIGLTWQAQPKQEDTIHHFELRPAWAVCMKESEMVKELFRRKEANLNLLAIF